MKVEGDSLYGYQKRAKVAEFDRGLVISFESL
jgi:hypothetical protein